MRTTRRKRNDKRSKRRVLYSTVLSLIIVFGIVLLSNNNSKAVATEESVKTEIIITIGEGDNLWKIAKKYRGTEDPQEFIFNLQQVNNLNTPIIHPGQSLIIPVS